MVRPACALAAFLALACPGRAADPAGPDEPALRQMNDDYVRAFLACDVARFRAILADDFTAVLADGRVIDKAEFLRQAAEPPDARDLRLHDVAIREYGDCALVAALVTYGRANGTAVRTRYSSIFARRQGRWEIVWVQWTRAAAP
ncbi:MAG TPA: nuclear transport factor 2 family protein [Opitutaceae bacterium]|nr:nuclear transport factor 2 family protein [Opitutaceae bacterium]